MSSERLARLVEFGGLNNMDSLLVTRHGRIVLEATYAPFRAGLKHRINSATKAVVSTLVAMAMRDGRLDSTDRRVMEFFADRTIANLDDAKKAITIRHLLDMTSGLEWSEGLDGFRSFFAMERSPDWQQFVLDRPMSTAPGTRFYYDSGNSHLLSAILTKVTGKSALDYARETLFGPLGIEDVLWRADPQGISGGGAGLYMHPRDMAKIGYLYLRGGVWEGKQILPASWIENVRKADVDMRETWTKDLRYGSQFWVMPGRDAYMAVGYDRQLIVVMPKLDIVAVTTGSARFATASGMPTRPRYGFDSLVSFLTSAVTADAPLARQSRGDGRARAKGEGGHHRAAVAGRRSAGDGQDDLRQDMAVRRPTTCGSSPSPARSTAPSRPSNTRPTATPASPPRRASAGRSASTAIIASADACATA